MVILSVDAVVVVVVVLDFVVVYPEARLRAV